MDMPTESAASQGSPASRSSSIALPLPSRPDPPRSNTTKVRVRTGCLICRARKVKCDEKRPSCQRCIKAKKNCFYKTPGNRRGLSEPVDSETEYVTNQGGQCMAGIDLGSNSPQTDAWTTDHGATPRRMPRSSCEAIPTDEATEAEHCLSTDEQLSELAPLDTPYMQGSVTNLGHTQAARSPSAARFAGTAKIIDLTLGLDMFPFSGESIHSSFSYFTEHVDCPYLSPFDSLNWKRIKSSIAQLGTQEISISRSISAVQVLYRVQVDRLPTAHAMTLHQAAIATFRSSVASSMIDLSIVLINAFLLCLFEAILPNQDSRTFNAVEAIPIENLEAWLQGDSQCPVALRICTWLQLLDTVAKRGGSPSFLSEVAFNLISERISEVPSLSSLYFDKDPGQALYDTISAPLFIFYLKVQRISNRVADVSHYRRSRITPEDQAEVSDILIGLKENLYALWNNRPGPLRLRAQELREYFHHEIAHPLVSTVGLYSAAYFAEFIVMGRTLGDPLFPSIEAKQAMKEIRDYVEGDWNSSTGDILNPGYLRPLFLYGAESFEEDEAQWAADRLRHIQNPMCRSTFCASFIEVHGEAQRSQQRRVTMKYFCCYKFGIPLPFM